MRGRASVEAAALNQETYRLASEASSPKLKCMAALVLATALAARPGGASLQKR